MKMLFRISITLLVFAFIINSGACKKKTGDNTCKTCRAFGVDGQVGERGVCSDAEEAKFRSDYSGKEISCTN